MNVDKLIAITAFVLALFFASETRLGRWLKDLALDLVNGLRAARRQRAMIMQARANLAQAIATRPKIVEVGSIEYNEAGLFVLNPDWLFEAKMEWLGARGGVVAGIDIDGQWRAWGYTQKEFEEIHARRSEFNVAS